MRQLREAREQSQAAVAKQLHIKQAAVSKLERRTDMYLSTLRNGMKGRGPELTARGYGRLRQSRTLRQFAGYVGQPLRFAR